jgi:hypothetical protein
MIPKGKLMTIQEPAVGVQMLNCLITGHAKKSQYSFLVMVHDTFGERGATRSGTVLIESNATGEVQSTLEMNNVCFVPL